MSKPKMMRAIRLDEVGPPENLKLVEREVPTPGDDEVLIRIEYASMMFSDAQARQGIYFSPTPIPWFPGRECAGVVEGVGKDVTRFKPGDRVMAMVQSGGCYAEYVTASASPFKSITDPADVLPLPDGASGDQALPYLMNFRFAHMLIHAYGKVRAGDTIFVHGATGGVGSMVVLQARSLGCRVISLCRSPKEAAYCMSLGSDFAFDTTSVDYVDAVLESTDGKGAQYSFNGVGGATLNEDPRALAPWGEILAYGYVAGKSTFDPFGNGARRSVALKTFAFHDCFETGAFEASTRAMLAWIADRPSMRLSPVFPLEEASKAHHLLDEGKVMGKLGLKI